MASLDSVRTRHYLARGVVQQVVDDTPVALRLRYLGTGAVTSVTVTTATNLVLIQTGTGETTETYPFTTTATTLGSLADQINAAGVYEAKILDGLRSDTIATSQFLENTAITAGTDANGVVCYDIHTDTSVLKAYTARLSFGRNFNVNKFARMGHVVHLLEVAYFADVNAAAADGVQVFLTNGTVESEVFGDASVDITKTTTNFASGNGKITSTDGGDIVVRVKDATSLTNHASGFLRAVGILE
jgi:hypothetical protein